MSFLKVKFYIEIENERKLGEVSLQNSGKMKFYEKLFIWLIMHQQDVTDKKFPTRKNIDI